MDQEEFKNTLGQLCKLTEALSIHQRQLSQKIEEIHSRHAHLYAHQDRIYSQIEALFSIHALIKIRYPLPTMRGWPVSPDFVKVLMELILDMKPLRIVETGSGVSSIVGGYCLEMNGQGMLTSYDNDEKYARETVNNIDRHRLGQYVSVTHAPLKPVTLQGETFLWYDTNCIRGEDKIDLLVIDGPPGGVQSMARYPALPVFFDMLSERAILLLDDAARDEEKKIVEAWLKLYRCFDYEYVDTENGVSILRRRLPG